jgi:NAD(P)-dependent dehydrogenase (short-subunit alcohol dehydrogenase family)
MGRLDGKVVLVTGGGGLLGAAFCRAMASEGAWVLVNDIDATRAGAVRAEIARAGGAVSAFVGSVDSWERARRIVDACVERFGRVDCLVNSAHTTVSAPLAELEEAQLRTTLERPSMRAGPYPWYEGVRTRRR